MEKIKCPICSSSSSQSHSRTRIVKYGFFKRKSDHRKVRRFKCLGCRKHFSLATTHPCFGQNKRHFNDKIRKLFCSGVSERRIARLLHVSRRTVSRKLRFLGQQAELSLKQKNSEHPAAAIIEFDDLETFEHTKLKPLSITLAVESKTRRILGFQVARMPAKGHLAALSRKKYGRRADERSVSRTRLFEGIKPYVLTTALIKSDQNPHYPIDVKRFFPKALHETHPGQRGSIVGQGELKKIRFDPLFSLNHTCAMLRANINRLFRRTWCTTKNPLRLADHISIYAEYHNKNLPKPDWPTR